MRFQTNSPGLEGTLASESVASCAPPARASNHSTHLRRVDCRAEFAHLGPAWDDLIRRTGQDPFLHHAFLRIWLDNFAPRADLEILTLVDSDGTLRAALPLMRSQTRWAGLPVRELRATTNVHACRFDLLAEHPEAAANTLMDDLGSRRDWDVLVMPEVLAGGQARALHKEARRRGWPTGHWASMASPWIRLPPTPEAMAGRLDAKFRANLRRRHRLLEAAGRARVERITDGPDLESVLARGLALEACGWKGRGGTAILSHANTAGFYTELARDQARRGQLALWALYLDDHLAAFQFGLEDRRRYLLLKTAYDENLGSCSPGQLLMEAVVNDAIGRGLSEIDFLGAQMPWKQAWTDQVRQHEWLFIFRDCSLGRVLWQLKFRWTPTVRRILAP